MAVTEIVDCLRSISNQVDGQNASDNVIIGLMDWSETRSTWSIPRMNDVFIGKLDYYHPFKLTTLVEKNKWKENGYFDHDMDALV